MGKTQSHDNDVQTSKFLSYILRHEPQSIGLRLDIEGWADIDELLHLAGKSGQGLSRDQLMRVVAQNDKKRFTISEDGTRIRAAQGHSAKQVDISFTPQMPPDELFHGTAERFLESIRSKGLVPGERQYVHLSSDYATAAAVGKRHGKPVVFTVRAAAMVQDGFSFYRSDNGVWLTREVPVQYLEGLIPENS